VKDLEDAVAIYQSQRAYDSVITKCGKCIETLARKVNKSHRLVREEQETGRLLHRFLEKEVINRFSEDPENREAFRLFAYTSYLIYTYRSKLGAHTDEKLWWGRDQIALSALVLTFYLIDLFATRISQ